MKKIYGTFVATFLCLFLPFGIKSAMSDVHIPGDTSVGTWDPVSRTYTLTTDVNDTIIIDEYSLVLDGDGHWVNGPGSQGVRFYEGISGVTIKNLNLQGFGCGIYLGEWECNNNRMVGNKVYDNGTGIYVRYSRFSTLIGNDISNNGTGVALEGSYPEWDMGDHILTGNDISNNEFGILFHGCGHNNVTGNNISNNAFGVSFGIQFFMAQDSDVSDEEYGPRDWFVVENTLTDNNISNNDYGVVFGSILPEHIPEHIGDNRVYNNNFIDNTIQAIDGSEWPGGNIFNLDKPVGGNYWSDHTGPDNDGDGFVDLPYVFAGGQDNLPWVRKDGWKTDLDGLIALVESMGLHRGIQNSLIAKLEGAKAALERGQEHVAINKLNAFINEVEAQKGKKLTDEQADELIAYANRIISALGATAAGATRPAEFVILQNYPDPFNPDTWIPYQLAEDVDVTIRIHDISGRLIRVLDLGHKPAGAYVSRDKAAYWDGRDEANEHVASGVYFYTIHAANFTGTRKMVILR